MDHLQNARTHFWVLVAKLPHLIWLKVCYYPHF